MNHSSIRLPALLSRLLGYTRRDRTEPSDPTEAEHREHEHNGLTGMSAPVAARIQPRHGRPRPRLASTWSLTLLLFGAAAFIAVLNLVSGENASLTLLPTTFVILFVVAVASLRRS